MFVSESYWMSPIAAFAVALFGISYLRVSSTVWALATGLILAFVLERRTSKPAQQSDETEAVRISS